MSIAQRRKEPLSLYPVANFRYIFRYILYRHFELCGPYSYMYSP